MKAQDDLILQLTKNDAQLLKKYFYLEDGSSDFVVLKDLNYKDSSYTKLEKMNLLNCLSYKDYSAQGSYSTTYTTKWAISDAGIALYKKWEKIINLIMEQ